MKFDKTLREEPKEINVVCKMLVGKISFEKLKKDVEK